MSISIALVGAHSTGKSSLISSLSDHLIAKGYEVTQIAELSRQCPYPINEATSLQAQSWIQKEQIALESQWKKTTILLSDRCALDNFAYMTLACPEDDLSEYQARAIKATKTYDFVFKTQLLPIPAEDDGVRSIDPTFRSAIDTTIFSLFVDHAVPFIALPYSYNYDTHVAFIWSHIRKHLYQDSNK